MQNQSLRSQTLSNHLSFTGGMHWHGVAEIHAVHQMQPIFKREQIFYSGKEASAIKYPSDTLKYP